MYRIKHVEIKTSWTYTTIYKYIYIYIYIYFEGGGNSKKSITAIFFWNSREMDMVELKMLLVNQYNSLQQISLESQENPSQHFLLEFQGNGYR